MANLKNAADNGTLLALGLVGVVAAAGAVATRGSGSAARGSSRSVLGVVHVDDPYEDTRPGWYVTNLETGAPLAGPFRSSGLAKERQRRLEQRGRA